MKTLISSAAVLHVFLKQISCWGSSDAQNQMKRMTQTQTLHTYLIICTMSLQKGMKCLSSMWPVFDKQTTCHWRLSLKAVVLGIIENFWWHRLFFLYVLESFPSLTSTNLTCGQTRY